MVIAAPPPPLPLPTRTRTRSVSPLTRSFARSRLGSPVFARPLPSSLAVAASRLGADAPPPGTPLRALGVPCSNTSPHTPIAVRPPAAAPC